MSCPHPGRPDHALGPDAERPAPSAPAPSAPAPTASAPSAPDPSAPDPSAPGRTPPAPAGGADPEPEHGSGPDLDFGGRAAPYENYIHAELLTHLQKPNTDDPAELQFIVTTQVMELWFTLLVHEWTTARDALDRDDLPTALAALHRSRPQLEAMNAAWRPLASLTPAQFNSYRASLGEASGFQSPTYRRLEFLLGEKNPSMLVPHRAVPRTHAELSAALREPSLYDAVLRHLARRGLPVPRSVLERDAAEAYRSDPGVEEVWAQVYSGPQDDPLVRLGEALTDVAELVGRWREDHLLATRRAMGAKPGTGGSAGVAWLEKRAAALVFPELWSARGRV